MFPDLNFEDRIEKEIALALKKSLESVVFSFLTSESVRTLLSIEIKPDPKFGFSGIDRDKYRNENSALFLSKIQTEPDNLYVVEQMNFFSELLLGNLGCAIQLLTIGGVDTKDVEKVFLEFLYSFDFRFYSYFTTYFMNRYEFDKGLNFEVYARMFVKENTRGVLSNDLLIEKNVSHVHNLLRTIIQYSIPEVEEATDCTKTGVNGDCKYDMQHHLNRLGSMIFNYFSDPVLPDNLKIMYSMILMVEYINQLSATKKYSQQEIYNEIITFTRVSIGKKQEYLEISDEIMRAALSEFIKTYAFLIGDGNEGQILEYVFFEYSQIYTE